MAAAERPSVPGLEQTAAAWLAANDQPLRPAGLLTVAVQLPYVTVNRHHEPPLATLDDSVQQAACLLMGRRRPPVSLPEPACACQPQLHVRQVLLSGSGRECSMVLLIDGDCKSDIDVMFELGGVAVQWPGRAAPAAEPGQTLLIARQTERTGFVLLESPRLPDCRPPQRHLFSAARARELLQGFPALFGEVAPQTAGPAQNTAFRYYNPYPCDLLVCLPLTRWPADEYAARLRPAGWPSPGLVRGLCRTPALLVPVGSPGTAHETDQWRISFSRHEYAAYRALTHQQRVCFVLLKHCKAALGDQLSGLKSYYLKTALMWLSERLPPDAWEDTHASLLAILDFLAEAAARGQLACYFCADMNVLSSRSEPELAALAGSVTTLRERLVSSLLALTAACYQRATVDQLANRFLLQDLPAVDVDKELFSMCRAPVVEPDHGAQVMFLAWLNRVENLEYHDPLNFRTPNCCLPDIEDRWLVDEVAEGAEYVDDEMNPAAAVRAGGRDDDAEDTISPAAAVRAGGKDDDAEDKMDPAAGGRDDVQPEETDSRGPIKWCICC